jgi:hypothetical protein
VSLEVGELNIQEKRGRAGTDQEVFLQSQTMRRVVLKRTSDGTDGLAYTKFSVLCEGGAAANLARAKRQRQGNLLIAERLPYHW